MFIVCVWYEYRVYVGCAQPHTTVYVMVYTINLNILYNSYKTDELRVKQRVYPNTNV